MIKTLTSGSPSLTVSSYNPPHIYGHGNMVGNMRYNTNIQAYEVYDGNNWLMVSQQATVSLSYEAEEALRWSRSKMEEEKNLKERLEKHPGLKDAWEKFQVMDILTKEEEDEHQRP